MVSLGGQSMPKDFSNWWTIEGREDVEGKFG